MFPKNLKDWILFKSKFKKEPISINKQTCKNCKSNYTQQNSNFNNSLLFFDLHIPVPTITFCDLSSNEICQHIISQLDFDRCLLSSNEWTQNVIQKIPYENYTYCNTNSGLWCSDVIKKLKGNI
jgi:hypothetical protein